MYKISCFADISDGKAGMMVPIFSKSGLNLPYVQEMDEYYIASSFIPFLEYENYPIVSFSGDLSAAEGDLGVVAFRRPNGELFCGSIDKAIEYGDQNAEEIQSNPIFWVQINRLIGADMQHSFDPWRKAAASAFADESQQKLWLSSEMSLHQKQAAIWRDLGTPDEDHQDANLPGDIREYSQEFLIRWLADGSNLTSKSWSQIWRRVVENTPFDSRLPDIGLSWLFSNLVENSDIQSVKWVLYSYFAMQYYDRIDRSEFAHFLCESAKEGRYLLIDIARPRGMFLQIVRFIIENADDDRFFTFLSMMINLGIGHADIKSLVMRAVKRKVGSVRVVEGVDPLKRFGLAAADYQKWLV